MERDEIYLTEGEIKGAVKRHLKKYPVHKIYQLRRMVANTATDKAIKKIVEWLIEHNEHHDGSLYISPTETLGALKNMVVDLQ